MPLAHVCPSCGRQLARVRAVMDPVYSLPVVVCHCGYAAVRRRHPLVVNYRRARAAAIATVVLVLHTFFIVMLAFANAGLIMVFERDLRVEVRATPLAFFKSFITPSPVSNAARRWVDDGGVILFIAIPGVAILSGMWLRAALAHWRWPRPLLAWAVLVSAWVWLETIFWPLTWLHGQLTGRRAVYSGNNLESSVNLLCFLGIVLAITAAATPLGLLVSRIANWNRKTRFRKILTRRRRIRRGE